MRTVNVGAAAWLAVILSLFAGAPAKCGADNGATHRARPNVRAKLAETSPRPSAGGPAIGVADPLLALDGRPRI